jgi:hypothetical protein
MQEGHAGMQHTAKERDCTQGGEGGRCQDDEGSEGKGGVATATARLEGQSMQGKRVWMHQCSRAGQV